jgi:hypothetical protein
MSLHDALADRLLGKRGLLTRDQAQPRLDLGGSCRRRGWRSHRNQRRCWSRRRHGRRCACGCDRSARRGGRRCACRGRRREGLGRRGLWGWLGRLRLGHRVGARRTARHSRRTRKSRARSRSVPSRQCIRARIGMIRLGRLVPLVGLVRFFWAHLQPLEDVLRDVLRSCRRARTRVGRARGQGLRGRAALGGIGRMGRGRCCGRRCNQFGGAALGGRGRVILSAAREGEKDSAAERPGAMHRQFRDEVTSRISHGLRSPF